MDLDKLDQRGRLGGPADLRPIEERDVADVLALNEAEVFWLAPMDEGRLWEIHAVADQFLVVELDGRFAGFVVTVGPGTSYDSENYRWFGDRYGDSFSYLDRVALTAATRRRGVGSQVYDVAEAAARPFGRLALEVRQEPPNEVSLAFHRSRGFEPVGVLGDPGHRNTLMVKELAP
ncbi:GNAT family N-acetyltransferase [Nocardioides marmoribigeumensis]|uniref:GNAT superfamily acetyltransferase n=1 Tax=Nocardioides marmoribigeumensis TaxID=433649 RepID=A0ABU2BVW7_9ACTN|nr:GNAT family N-acetyltransferase [Nocardioides marmoribigeumensis]MDR7362770.1 putative GNAT superfamily acetyltransferase [Nocardioides marmoribigeumensis]